MIKLHIIHNIYFYILFINLLIDFKLNTIEKKTFK